MKKLNGKAIRIIYRYVLKYNWKIEVISDSVCLVSLRKNIYCYNNKEGFLLLKAKNERQDEKRLD